MTTLSYKGYQGSVTYDDGSLLIQILHINDFISTNCLSAEDVRKQFEALVDDYLETCAEIGKEPQKPFKGTFNVRVTPELHRQAAMAAANLGQSLNAWVMDAVNERLRREEDRETELLRALMEKDLMEFSQPNPWAISHHVIVSRAAGKAVRKRDDLDPKGFVKYPDQSSKDIQRRKMN